MILCTSVFGAAVVQQQVPPTDLPAQNVDEKPSNEEPRIANLEQTVIYLTLPTIVNFFKPELHESITPSVEEALNEIDVSNIMKIIHLLTQKFEARNDNEISQEAIKNLIIGMNSALSLMEEDSQHQEEEDSAKDAVIQQKVATIPTAAPPLESPGKEPLVAAPHVPANAPSMHNPAIATPQQALQSRHAPVNEQLAVQKAPPPVAHPPLRHQAKRNPELR